ncbi:hypothetical protein [Membranihabitans marinus]|uniref:hypothetical protein n=1 Tax=Membranihabitans marinus TaxID=1227546 RepID=UPI001F449BD1|nr:hypothetical protein [Membranihabitans marinus]
MNDGFKRRLFLQKSLLGGASLLVHPVISALPDGKNLDYSLDHIKPTKLFDGEKCWVHPRAGIVPKLGEGKNPRVVMTMNTLDLIGSDVFKGMYGMQTDDMGQNWTEAEKIPGLTPRFEEIDSVQRPVAASDFWPQYHRKSGVLLGIGHTVVYTPEWKVVMPRPRQTSYSVYDESTGEWREWKKLAMPNEEKFVNAGAGCAQRYDNKDGTIFLPLSFYPSGKNSHITVVKCGFDGRDLTYISQGNELNVDDDTRGLHEASMTRYKGKYYMTIRNDKKGFITSSDDGLQYQPIRPWTFDDGSDLGSYNTQQHWVTHSKGLFLVYTRRGANNDHVFRHRAPLFMARVDEEKMCVIRSTERILVEEKGARLGNFGVCDVSKDETWVTVSEWMQPKGVEKYGSDGSVWIAKIKWNQANRYFKA